MADPARMVDAVEAAVASVAARGRIPVVLGGEHTVSVGRGEGRWRGERSPSWSVSTPTPTSRTPTRAPKYSHACFLRRAREVADGLRDRSAQHNAGKRWTTRAVRGPGSSTPTRLPGRVSARLILTSCPIPFTSALMWTCWIRRSCRPPGLRSRAASAGMMLIDLVTRIVRGRKVVGFDVVELCPLAGNPAPDYTAAKLAVQGDGHHRQVRFQAGGR